MVTMDGIGIRNHENLKFDTEFWHNGETAIHTRRHHPRTMVCSSENPLRGRTITAEKLFASAKKTTIMTKRKRHIRSQQKRASIHSINPDMPDIAGENVHLKLKERNVPPFFRSLLDADRPLPNHVRLTRHHEPEMGEAIPLLVLAFLFCFLPAVALLVHFVTKQMYEVFPLVVFSLLLLAFGYVLYRAGKTYRNVKAFQRSKGRYGIFLCRYALFVRFYHESKECQLFPKHTLMDVVYHEGKHPKSQSLSYAVTLQYNNANGKKASHQLLGGFGSFPTIERVLRDWLDRPLDIQPLVNALDAQDAWLRRQAANILKEVGWTPHGQEQRAAYLLAQEAWTELEKMVTEIPCALLVKRLHDHDPAIRAETAKLLAHIKWGPETSRERVYYFLTVRHWDTFLALGMPTTPDPLLEVLGDDAPVFQEASTAALSEIYGSVTHIVFGDAQVSEQSQGFTLHNPDVVDLRFPMKQLQHILIATVTYDALVVERFMLYAMNVIGRRHLKRHVAVHLYGSPDRLSSNLQNLMTRLCKSVDASSFDHVYP